MTSVCTGSKRSLYQVERNIQAKAVHAMKSAQLV